MPTGRARRQTVLVIGLAVVAVGLSAAAIPTLRQNARVEFLDREVALNLTPSQSDRQRLANLLERLNASPDKDDSPTLLLAESDVRYLLARLDDTIASNPSTPEAIAQRYLETGPFAKRLNWATQVGTADSIDTSAEAEVAQNIATPEYEESFSLAKRSLMLLPLNRRARTNILYLDFIPKSPALTQAVLLQLEQLYRRQSTALIKIGRFAADSGDRETAIRVWRQALILEPQRTALVLETISPYNTIDVLEVLPESQEVLRRAAGYLLTEADADQETLRHIGQLIDCESCRTHATRSNCEELLGDLEYSLGRREIAYDNYRQAIHFSPQPTKLRQTLIARFENQGDHDAALAMRESMHEYDGGEKTTESTP